MQFVSVKSNFLKWIKKNQTYFINRHNHVASLYCLKEATVIDGGPREVNDIIKHYSRGEFGNVQNPNFDGLIWFIFKIKYC